MKTKPQLSVCIPSVQAVADLDEETNKFKGMFAAPVNEILNMVRTVLNVTLISSSQQVELKNATTGEYSGCFGMLQRGEADLAGFPYVMPLIGIDNITQVNSSAIDTGVWMLAPYSNAEKGRELLSDPLNSFKSVSLEVWTHMIVFSLVFWIFLNFVKNVYYKRRDRNNNPLIGQSLTYQVASHMAQVESYDYSGSNERYLSFLMSLLAFFFITFFSSLITTEKVTTKDIFVYDTYERIWENKSVQPIWVEILYDYYWYRDAEPGSRQRKIWDQSVAIQNQSDDKPSLFKIDVSSLVLKMAQRAREQDFVVFVTKMFTEIFIGGMCLAIPAIPGYPDLRFKGRLDTELRSSLYVLPISRFSKSESVIHSVINVCIENAILQDPGFNAKLRDHLGNGLPSKSKFDDQFFQCLKYDKLPKSEPSVIALNFFNIKNLLYVYFGVNGLAFIFFLYERSVVNQKIQCN